MYEYLRRYNQRSLSVLCVHMPNLQLTHVLETHLYSSIFNTTNTWVYNFLKHVWNVFVGSR